MKYHLVLVALCMAGCASPERAPQTGTVSTTTAPSAAVGDHVRIGTYDSRAVAIAYAQSAQFKASISDLKGRHQAAKEAGDAKLVSELEHKGELSQIRLHLQGFSNAPVDDCLDPIRAELPAIAQRRGVMVITAKADWSSAEVVDVTEDITALFHPDANGMRVIKEMRSQKPLPIEEVAKLPAND